MVTDLDTGAAGPVLLGLVFVLAYLLGSIPFGIVLTRLAGGPDLRTIGSGNIGATNVLRTGKRGLAALTLVGDMLKGTLAVVLASRFGETAALVAGLAAFLGHCFPVWLKFRGGKGVATYLGILLGFHFPTAIAVAGVWLLTAFASRFSSLAALIASAAAPVILFLLGHQRLAELFLVLTLIVWVRHRGNIGRLMAGEESRIGAK